MSTYKLVCPSCYGPLVIRTSEGQTPCFRSMYYQCKDLVCGATFSGSLTIDYTLSPSGLAKPINVVPPAPSLARKQALRDRRTKDDQLDLLEQFNDMEQER
ncbi:ogr/Delta-like zinc finger family protein [Pseudomonas viridiflava]|uniref:ogr/Delta-like zinc finger family protein n=1 Tax=Pseudomonas viridiflava TaxID=33069 RepID=UPI001F601C8B|nr:ogr/Delta-like zinc finger family protein [Pseudomonas viridiflava]MCI3908827.1 ogr/Delta-like zinc finger family protein [Pseudomonas viridiflava]